MSHNKNWSDRQTNIASRPSLRHTGTYLEARRTLTAALNSKGLKAAEFTPVPEALARLTQSFEGSVIEPLLREAEATPNAMRGALLMAAAEVVERLHQSSPLVVASRGRGQGSHETREQMMSAKELDVRIRLVDQLVAIKRELSPKR